MKTLPTYGQLQSAEIDRLRCINADLLWRLKDCVIALEHLQNGMAVRVNPPTLENAIEAISKAEQS